ncbi:hypothetical protein L249_4335 [Ophiocordyceps polyrhachis-furcata BCC 54312]|uniref:Uncharacterized protein n=1 Tax=Ophiocordyceps polyrhachis-furcata BCC 54312 TaxID=1330021 RepID=A0A367L7W3_9HYPO|nr:hypothetical protein L249_4335 [Ophiocordyceps polyrhachis-furcata BCC 54312]
MHSSQILGCMVAAFGMLETVSCVPPYVNTKAMISTKPVISTTPVRTNNPAPPALGSGYKILPRKNATSKSKPSLLPPNNNNKFMKPSVLHEAFPCQYPDGRVRPCHNVRAGVTVREEMPWRKELRKEDKELEEELLKDQKKQHEKKMRQEGKDPRDAEEPLPELLPVEEVLYNCTFRSVNRRERKCWLLFFCTGMIVDRWSELLLHKPSNDEGKRLHLEKDFPTRSRRLVYSPKSVGIREPLAHKWDGGAECSFQLDGKVQLSPEMYNSSSKPHPLAGYEEETCAAHFPCHLSLRDEQVKM